MSLVAFWMAVLLLAVIFVSGVYDIYAVYAWGHEYTISYILRQWAYRYPVLLLFLGMLLWHLFGITEKAGQDPIEPMPGSKEAAQMSRLS